MPVSVSEKLCYSTIRILCDLSNGTSSVGTGFFYVIRKGNLPRPYIFTNKHVIKDSKVGHIRFTLADADGNPRVGHYRDFEIAEFESLWITHPNPDVDLCCLDITNIVSLTFRAGIRLFYMPCDNSIIPDKATLDGLAAIEEVTMVGYPTGLWDSANNMPIIRRGITATQPRIDYNGKKEFVIDIAAFPGSSGSPVFLFNEGIYTSGNAVLPGPRIKLLGVLYSGPVLTATGEILSVDIPTAQTQISQTQVMINLGNVIKSDRILELEKIVMSSIAP